ncbi:Divalent metal cation transporter MntH [Rhodovastum atsumiense]|uniref:Divalent metal cation transporter MntH n=1 Tax=Rhodovastum atsumiense TaxID=504468 RepID=A0A5M6J1G2_9PROT|nr:Nramp family divalent metal transporter [Rhodovastum atsumiense]KAA5613907.1 divalent metal cation transporter [Rhodovastum atsumiense]CAH2602035.1 Divalent metal cation transporter MntH [Rhodovastum atsumiense]
MFSLPKTATGPFCPSEVRGSVPVDAAAPLWRKVLRFSGPGLLVSVGYMDPGNWATGIEGGSRFGYDLLFVVLLSSLAAIVLQCLSARLGIATGRDLARLSNEQYGPFARRALWLLAELSIIACDLAEVLGSALAFHLLLGVPILAGVGLTALDTLIVLGLQGRKFRSLEAIVLGLILTIGVCFLVELVLLRPDLSAVAGGFVPSLRTLGDLDAIGIAVGVIGATVMPHNLYLHSAIVQTRVVAEDERSIRQAIRLSNIDTIASLLLALAINAAIMILAASAFHANGQQVGGIEDAYHLLDPIVGTSLAGVLFAVALLASGQSSTFTGTIAGQILMEGFLDLKIPCWQRRLITRGLALVPAFAGLWWLGDGGVGFLLVASQVALSLQLPFAVYPLVRFSADRRLMGDAVTPRWMQRLAWLIFAAVVAANAWLVVQAVRG